MRQEWLTFLVPAQVALIDEQLQMLADSGAFKFPNGTRVLSAYIQPASIDLPVTGNIYLVKEKVLPFQQRVSDLIEGLTLETKSLSGNGAVLLKGQVWAASSPSHTPVFARSALAP